MESVGRIREPTVVAIGGVAKIDGGASGTVSSEPISCHGWEPSGNWIGSRCVHRFYICELTTYGITQGTIHLALPTRFAGALGLFSLERKSFRASCHKFQHVMLSSLNRHRI
jgi:hypothetical protein